jgi:hypothetical protein
MTNFYKLLKEAAEKKKMDRVGKETADIDNDGDTDSSDKYLHNRRKAISKNMKKEEVEGLDELSKKTKEVVFTGSPQHTAKKAAEHKKMGYKVVSMKKHTSGSFGDNSEKHTYKMAKEEVEQVDEAETTFVIKHKKSREVLSTHSNHADAKDEHSGLKDKENYGIYKQTKKDSALHNRNTYREEAEQVDEKMSNDDKSSIALSKLVAKYKLKDAAKETRPGYVKKQSQEWYDKMTKKANAKIGEEVEQIDEISKDLASRYVNKAKQDETGKRRNSIELALKKKFGNKKYGIPEPKVKATEEVEQVDELKDTTVQSYRDKAFKDQPAGDDGSAKYRKRKFGRDLAYDKQTGRAKVKTTKEEAEQVDELSSGTYKRAMDAAVKKAGWLMPGDKGKGDKAWNRAKKFQKAGMAQIEKEKKMKKEEVEMNNKLLEMALDKLTEEELNAILEAAQLDELSKKTLGSYVKKSADNLTDIQRDITSGGTKDPEYKSFSRMRRNRKAGIKNAVNKLTKEEIEEVESSADPLITAMVDFIKNEKK